MAENKLEVMENRLLELENRIFGDTDKDVAYPKESTEMIDALVGMNTHIHQSISGRSRIEAVLKKLADLENYLDPSFTDQIALSPEAKVEIILTAEQLILQQAANLEKVKNMSDVLSSEHIKNVPEMTGKLQELSQVHLQQQDDAVELCEETKALLLNYNNTITLISKQFVQWDKILTQIEEAQAQKKEIRD